MSRSEGCGRLRRNTTVCGSGASMASTLAYHSLRGFSRSLAGASAASRTTSKVYLTSLRGERLAVVPLHVLPEEEDEVPVVVLPRPLLGELGDDGVGALHRLERVEEDEVGVARGDRPHAGDGGRLVDGEARRVLDQHGVEDAAALGRLAGAPVAISAPSNPAASTSEHNERRVIERTSLRGECTPSSNAARPVRLRREPTKQDRHRDHHDASRPERRRPRAGRSRCPARWARRRNRGRTASGRRSWRRHSCRRGRHPPRRRPVRPRSRRRPCSTPRTRTC